MQVFGNHLSATRKLIARMLAITLLSATAPQAQSAWPQQQPAQNQPGPQDQLSAQTQQQLKDFYERYVKQAKQLTGPRVVNDVSYPDAILATLMYVRDIYTAQLDGFISQMNNLAAAPQAVQDARIQDLIRNTAAVNLSDNVGKLTNENLLDGQPLYGSALTAEKLYQDAADRAQYFNPQEADWWRKLAKQPGSEQIHLIAQHRDELLARDPLLTVVSPGFDWPNFQALIHSVSGEYGRAPGALEKLRPELQRYVGIAIQQAKAERERVNKINSVEGIAEFLNPQYQQVWRAAAPALGPASQQLINLLIPFAQSHYEVRAGQSEQTRLKVALFVTIAGGFAVVLTAPAAGVLGTAYATSSTAANAAVVGNALNAGAATVQLVYDGKRWVAISNELQNAQNAQGVLGQGAVQGLEQKQTGATVAVGLDLVLVGVTAKDLGVAMDKAVRANQAGANASAAGALASQPSAAGATGGVALAPKLQPIANEFGPDVALGVQAGKQLGISETEIQNALSVVRLGEKQAVSMEEVARAGVTARQALVDLGNTQNTINAARRAGLSETTINTALNAAKKAGTVEAWGVLFPRQLGITTAIATIRNEGGVVLMAPEELNALRPQELIPFQEAQAAGGLKTTGFLSDLLSLRAKITLLARGRTGVTLTQTELRLLNDHVLPEGQGILKWFGYDPDSREFYQVFDKQFMKNLRSALESSAASGNTSAKSALATLDFATVGATPAASGASSVAPPSGAAQSVDMLNLQPSQVGQLSDQVLRNMPKETFAAYPPATQQAIREEILRRGLAPRVGISATSGNLPLNAQAGAQRYEYLVQRLSNDDLKKLATKLSGDPNADPALRAAINTEVTNRNLPVPPGGAGTVGEGQPGGLPPTNQPLRNQAQNVLPSGPTPGNTLSNPATSGGQGPAALVAGAVFDTPPTNPRSSGSQGPNTAPGTPQAGGAAMNPLAPATPTSPRSLPQAPAPPAPPCPQAAADCAKFEAEYEEANEKMHEAEWAYEGAVAEAGRTAKAMNQAAIDYEAALKSGANSAAAISAREALESARAADNQAVKAQTDAMTAARKASDEVDKAYQELQDCYAKAAQKCQPNTGQSALPAPPTPPTGVTPTPATSPSSPSPNSGGQGQNIPGGGPGADGAGVNPSVPSPTLPGNGVPQAPCPQAAADCDQLEAELEVANQRLREAESALDDASAEAARTAAAMNQTATDYEAALKSGANSAAAVSAADALARAKAADGQAVQAQVNAANTVAKANVEDGNAWRKLQDCYAKAAQKCPPKTGQSVTPTAPTPPTSAIPSPATPASPQAAPGSATAPPQPADTTQTSPTPSTPTGPPKMPPCKKSDGDCAEFQRYAAQKQAEAVLAQAAAEQAPSLLWQADFQHQVAINWHRMADSDFSLAGQYGGLYDQARDRAKSATNEADARAASQDAAAWAKEQQNYLTRARAEQKSGDDAEAESQRLRQQAQALQAAAAAAAKAAADAAQALKDCLALPPCPTESSTTPQPPTETTPQAAPPTTVSPSSIPLPANAEVSTTLTVENHCPTAQSFRIESQGLPASLLKTSGSVSIGGGASTDFPIKLNTVGLAPGTYSGNIVVICVTCGDTCKQDRSIFPIQFSVAAGSNK